MGRLKVLIVASECVPLIKSGGLGDVVGALAPALARRGHEVRVVIPRYRALKDFPAEKLPLPLSVALADRLFGAAVYRGELAGGVAVYLLEHDAFFNRSGLYGDEGGDFGDNLLRFAFLSKAALALPQYLGFRPDLMHLHDWQAALVAVYSRAFDLGVPTVLTIHNLGYQGRFGRGQFADVGLSWKQCEDGGLEFFGDVNVLKGGLSCATQLSTVSPRYASEIKTSEGGAGLDGVLRQRPVVGILNGIDEREWDPSRDPHIAANYDARDLSGKAKCKAALQGEMGLAPRAEVPLLGMISRLAEQKGIDLFIESLAELSRHDLQFVVLGSGERWVEEKLQQLSERQPCVAVRFGLNEALAHRIEAGADLFVMPSRYEPCGLNQLYSQRYATLPVVRAVGGLDDTVQDGETGFKFAELSSDALTAAVLRAVDVYRRKPDYHRSMQQAAMAKSMGWDQAASRYQALYQLAIRQRPAR